MSNGRLLGRHLWLWTALASIVVQRFVKWQILPTGRTTTAARLPVCRRNINGDVAIDPCTIRTAYNTRVVETELRPGCDVIDSEQPEMGHVVVHTYRHHE